MNGDVVPTPDPTVLTMEAVARGDSAERDYVDGQLDVLRERLRGMDVATQVLNETVTRVPTDVQKEVSHLRELTEEQLRSVGRQFAERDTRSERESRDNKLAVDAAFAAQEKQAAAAAKANAEAIGKSEAGTSETIKTNAELFRTTTDALSGTISDLKERVVAIESAKTSAAETRTEGRLNLGQVMVAASVLISAASVVVGLIATR